MTTDTQKLHDAKNQIAKIREVWFKDFSTIRKQVFTVLDQEVEMRSPTMKEVLEIRSKLEYDNKQKTQNNQEGAEALRTKELLHLVIKKTFIKDTENLIFNDADFDRLLTSSANTKLDELITQMVIFCQFYQKAEEVKKNSKIPPPDSTSSTLQTELKEQSKKLNN